MNVAVKELSKSEINHIKKKDEYEGKVFNTNNYGDVVVLEYINRENVRLKFMDTGNERCAWMNDIKKGNIKDMDAPSVYGVGIVSKSMKEYTIKYQKESKLWGGMLERCYSGTSLAVRKTYKGCAVSDCWKYFSNFKDWCDTQKYLHEEGFSLDKDILVKGNKVYSPETCCIVPHEINSLFTKTNSKRGDTPIGVHLRKKTNTYIAYLNKCGKRVNLGTFKTSTEAFQAYKHEKEKYIKEVADKYKEVIDPKVHGAMYAWTVDIDD